MLKFMPSDDKPWIENYAILLPARCDGDGDVGQRMIGTVGATRVLPDEGAIEIAYGLHPDFWKKGYMHEALGMFIKIYWAENSTSSKPSTSPPSFSVFITCTFTSVEQLLAFHHLRTWEMLTLFPKERSLEIGLWLKLIRTMLLAGNSLRG